jgi:uracil-DNA glycosylase
MNAQQSSPVPNIDPGWLLRLKTAFEADHFAELKRFIKKERTNGTVHPAPDRILHAFLVTPFDQVQVVILGKTPTMARARPMASAFRCPKAWHPHPPCRTSSKK